MNSVEIEMERIDCASCGMICFLPQNFIQIKKKNYQEFFCGAGHRLIFTNPNKLTVENLQCKIKTLETDNKKLKTEKFQLIHRIDQANIPSEEPSA